MKGILIILICVLCSGLIADEKRIDTEAVVEKAEKSQKELIEEVNRERLEKYRAEIVSNAKKITTIKSSFRQVKHLSFLSDKVETGGIFLLKKQNGTSFVKWQYTTPFSYQIVLDGRNVLTKDGEKVTSFDMSSNSVFEELNDIMIGSLNGTILSDNEKFNFEIEERGRKLNVNMIPVESSMKEFFKEIKMIIDKNDYTVTKLEMIEKSGDSTEIFFTDRKTNIPIKDNEFHLK